MSSRAPAALPIRLAAVSGLIAFAVCPAGQVEPPYALAVRVEAAREAVAAHVQEDVRSALLDELEGRSCVAELVPEVPGERPEAPLVLRVVLLSAGEEVRHEESLAELSDPDRPPILTRPAAEFEIRGVAQVLAVGQEHRVIRSKALTARVGAASSRLGDPREEARRRTVDALARKVRAFLCRTSKRAIRDAVAGASTPRTADR